MNSNSIWHFHHRCYPIQAIKWHQIEVKIFLFSFQNLLMRPKMTIRIKIRSSLQNEKKIEYVNEDFNQQILAWGSLYKVTHKVAYIYANYEAYRVVTSQYNLRGCHSNPHKQLPSVYRGCMYILQYYNSIKSIMKLHT